MGLDIVELIMEIEDSFGITITDEEYLELQTVGQLNACVLVNVLEQVNQINEDNQLFEAIQKLPENVPVGNIRETIMKEKIIPKNFEEFSGIVYSKLVGILSIQSGVPVEQIKPDSSIYQLFEF